MLKRLFNQVSTALQDSDSTDEGPARSEAALQMATAVLMVDVARADSDFDETEFERLVQLIESHFDLTADQAAELVNSAGEKAEDMVSLYEFTQMLNQHLDEEARNQIVSFLWQIAYADGRLDKFEDALVLKIGDLLYVKRARVMRLKHDAQESAGV